MRTRIPKILVTGGAGFIGSAFVRLLLGKELLGKGLFLTVVDKLTYAGDLERLKQVRDKIKFHKADICDKKRIESIFRKEKPGIVVNFAAETHVDRSIKDASPFIETNIRGTQLLLDISMKYQVKRFVHISTDEIYGEIKKGSFLEDSPLKPNSPYAASKAAVDLLIKAYMRTYVFPAIIVRPCNNYGSWQYPEKLIPLVILKILRKERVPVYADGKNVREWLFVEDCARGVFEIMKNGRIGEIYNLGSNDERENLEVVNIILKSLNASCKMIQFVKDRPGHDIRYKLNSGKTFRQIGWRPKVKFAAGIKITIQWYLEHRHWLLSKYKDIAELYK